MRALAIAGALTLGAFLAGNPAPAECGQGKWCPATPCFGSVVCKQCLCMSNEPGAGSCVSFDRAGQLEAEGWTRP